MAAKKTAKKPAAKKKAPAKKKAAKKTAKKKGRLAQAAVEVMTTTETVSPKQRKVA